MPHINNLLENYPRIGYRTVTSRNLSTIGLTFSFLTAIASRVSTLLAYVVNNQELLLNILVEYLQFFDVWFKELIVFEILVKVDFSSCFHENTQYITSSFVCRAVNNSNFYHF